MKKALCLLSGGFDSPVAAYRIANTGYHVDYLFFYSLPFVRERDKEIVIECVKILNKQTGHKSKLFIVDNEKLLSRLQENTDKTLHVVMRRIMMRIAEAFAKKNGYSALITGDSLGQVSSQTLSNLEAVTRAVKIPILRPLLGFDKEEIIRISEKIGTYDLSKQHKDCGLGAISSARTKASEKELHEIENRINYKEFLKDVVQNARILKI